MLPSTGSNEISELCIIQEHFFHYAGLYAQGLILQLPLSNWLYSAGDGFDNTPNQRIN